MKLAYLRKFMKTTSTFERVFRNLKFLTADNGEFIATLKVEPEHGGIMGNFNEGALNTLIDIATTVALLSHEHGYRPSVTVGLNLQYLECPKVGDDILIKSKILLVERKIAVMSAEVRSIENNALLTKGEHLKIFVNSSWPDYKE